jgi:putative Holliday junction resolvase
VGRILGLDYGRRRVGVAVSDPLGITAQPLTTWTGLGETELFRKIVSLIPEMDIQAVVVGDPLTTKGERGIMSERVGRFVRRLSQIISVPVHLQDERLTSVEAQRVLRDSGEKPSRNKEAVDRVSAVLILQTYLDRHSMKQRSSEGYD